MSQPARSQLLVSFGADVALRYGTLVRRLTTPTLGGEGLKETFTRSSTALRLASDGYYLQAQANAPRVEWLNGQAYLLLEGAGATNSLLQSNNLGASPWSLTHLTAGSRVGEDPLRGSTYTPLIPDATSTNGHMDAQAFTCTANENLAGSIDLNPAGGYSGARLWISDTAGGGTNGFWLAVDVNAGTIVASGAIGAGTFVNAAVQVLAAGTVRVLFWGTIGGGVTSAVATAIVFPTGAAANTGAAYAGNGTSYLSAWNYQVERNGAYPYAPTSPIVTAAATVARSSETFTIPLNNSPRALGLYLKGIELGQQFGSPSFSEYWIVGQYASSLPAEFLDLLAGSHTYTINHGKPNTSIVTSGGSIAPTFGQGFEVYALLFSDGSVQIIESLAGAPEIPGTRSAANPNGLGPVWGNSPVFYLGNGVSALGVVNGKIFDNSNPATAVTTLAAARAVPV